MTQHGFIQKGLTFGIILILITTGFSSVITANGQKSFSESRSLIIEEKTSIHQLFENNNTMHHILLYEFVYYAIAFRLIRTFILYFMSVRYVRDSYVIIHPLLYRRAERLQNTIWAWLDFWYAIANKYRWGWP
jgi:hypothetical protein